jgi:hypothetical protein
MGLSRDKKDISPCQVHLSTQSQFRINSQARFKETMFATYLAIACLLGTAAASTVGVDLSQATSLSSLQCVHDYGYDFVIARVYCSTGNPDSNGPSNINNAWNAGMAHVDGYIFPCYSCGNPGKQIDDTIDYLASHALYVHGTKEHLAATNNGTALGATIGMLWLDIEGTQYWSSSTSNNVNFIQGMVDEGRARGVSLGVYSSSSQWGPITGGTTQFSSLPLWYAHWDYSYSSCTSDFVSFGGWTSPAMKQYAGDESFCSAGFDKNCY